MKYNIKQNKTKKKSAFEINRRKQYERDVEAKYEVGDGKTPNKYFVTISDDYQILKPGTNELVSVNDLFGRQGDYKTAAVFDNYKDAKKYVENIIFGRKFDGIEVNSVQIEDRLSGQLYTNDKNHEKYEDLHFSINEEKKKGVKPTITEEDKW